ncbi:Hypothetical predicted protein [Paramuricea clavata]|uniref:Cartilage intermediate layer protein 1/2 beta-sandwich domain-containing protein n=1 Tax=Paramuricea clavata TaxID=317549 RepID=A0A7D9K8V0_PARCT|nr:Hypothetical predicted protein [Paramuricea clavata]
MGKCHKKKCIARGLKNINDCKDNFCCQPTATKKIKIDCERYSFDMTRVTKCGCGKCLDRQTVVKGVARGGPENIPFKYGYIYHGDKYLTRTGRKGEFSFKVPGDLSRLVVTFKDKRGYNDFQELTKVIALVPGRETYVEARMKLRPASITVNANEGFEIPLGNSRSLGTQNSGQPVGNAESDKESVPAVAVSLPPQSLIAEDGTVYNGEAKAEISFVDPRNATEVEEADGDFSTVNDDGEQELLETFGVIKMDFRDLNGNRLQPNRDIDVLFDLDEYNITEKEAENIKLWYMDKKTGRWRIMDQELKQHETRRSRRSGRKLFFGKFDARRFNYLGNLDSKVEQKCYLKIRVPDSETEEFQSTKITLATRKQLLNRYQVKYVRDGAACIETYCTEYLAVIQATRNGKYLIPKETGIDEDVNSRHVIKYYRSSDVSEQFSNKITMKKLTYPLSAKPSPFYYNSYSCRISPDENSFSFELPVNKEISKDLVEVFGPNWYPSSPQSKACFVKIAVENINSCPNRNASFAVESVLGDAQERAGTVIITLTENAACAEYKCPQNQYEKVRVNVIPITTGEFTKHHDATKNFIRKMKPDIFEIFSFKPSFYLRDPTIGINQSENELLIDGDGEEKNIWKRENCMGDQIKAGIRFKCKDSPF